MADDKQALRRMARAAISTGLLPVWQPARVWGGKGSGSTCALCARTIDAIELEFELEFEPQDGDAREDSLRMHARCFAVWDCERGMVGGTGIEPVTPAV